MKSILILFVLILILSNGISYYLGTEHAKNTAVQSEIITETKTVEINYEQPEQNREIVFEGETIDCRKLAEAKLLPQTEMRTAFGGTVAGSVNRAIAKVNEKIVRQKAECGLTLTEDEKALLESL